MRDNLNSQILDNDEEVQNQIFSIDELAFIEMPIIRNLEIHDTNFNFNQSTLSKTISLMQKQTASVLSTRTRVL